MKRALIAGGLLATAIAVIPFARSDDIQGRPPGISANDWVPISDRVGFVLVRSNKLPHATDPQVLMLKPPASGYFMLKGASGWTRMLIVDPSRGPSDAG
jgi:hypothetical protein